MEVRWQLQLRCNSNAGKSSVTLWVVVVVQGRDGFVHFTFERKKRETFDSYSGVYAVVVLRRCDTTTNGNVEVEEVERECRERG